MRSPITRALLIPLFLGALGGCTGMMEARQAVETPRQRALAARTEAVEKARTSLRAATAAGCEFAAPFEYYMAQEYFQLAEHELNGGDKDGVVEFADKSNAHSIKAIELAKGERK
jgi:hypothetical protein